MLHATYWNYDGNHHGGRDCERKDPHGFGIATISYLAKAAEGGISGSLLPTSLLDQVTVKHSKGDGFGHEVKVSAPREVWDAAAKDYEEVLVSLG